WSNTCHVSIKTRVRTVNSVGLSIGRVIEKNFRTGPAPSTSAASSMSWPMACRPARNRSMKVPDVVNTARAISAVIATDGPAIHSHQVTPSGPSPARNEGTEFTPSQLSTMWNTPRGSANQLGPLTLSQLRTPLTTPEAPNRYRNTTVIATELVTDGK